MGAGRTATRLSRTRLFDGHREGASRDAPRASRRMNRNRASKEPTRAPQCGSSEWRDEPSAAENRNCFDTSDESAGRPRGPQRPADQPRVSPQKTTVTQPAVEVAHILRAQGESLPGREAM